MFIRNQGLGNYTCLGTTETCLVGLCVTSRGKGDWHMGAWFVLALSLALISDLGGVSVEQPQSHHHTGRIEKLGTVSFPLSCASSVQGGFERGVALLHSFSYDEAEKQFRETAEKDPTCAMAYWGEAMSLYRQLWFRPEAPDLKRGWDLVQQAQRLGERATPRERAYIEALANFYRNYQNVGHQERATSYSKAMQEVHERYPDDTEAAALYGLSLLSSKPSSDTRLAYPRKAVSILSAGFEKNPDHPGVAHYLIHACDNPQMAELGLAAARRYAAIASASPHALHMPSHIFARLGLWQEDIQSNLASKAAAENPTRMHVGAEHRLHAMEFLEYAFLQIGDDEKAKAIVTEAAGVRKSDLDRGFDSYFNRMRAQFPALYFLETRQWKDAEALEPPAGAEPGNQALTYWARGVAAGHLRDVAVARSAVERFDEMVDAVRKGPQSYLADGMTTNRNEAGAWLAFAEGKNEEALVLLRPVADRQDQVGKGEVELPAREMLGDMLLEMARPQAALAEYAKSLKSDPNRFNGLYGAARAAELARQPQKASLYYAHLLKNCQNGTNSDRPELARAKNVLAQEELSK
jgi:tetratricopeptide (TPR) repeat protein